MDHLRNGGGDSDDHVAFELGDFVMDSLSPSAQQSGVLDEGRPAADTYIYAQAAAANSDATTTTAVAPPPLLIMVVVLLVRLAHDTAIDAAFSSQLLLAALLKLLQITIENGGVGVGVGVGGGGIGSQKIFGTYACQAVKLLTDDMRQNPQIWWPRAGMTFSNSAVDLWKKFETLLQMAPGSSQQAAAAAAVDAAAVIDGSVATTAASVAAVGADNWRQPWRLPEDQEVQGCPLFEGAEHLSLMTDKPEPASELEQINLRAASLCAFGHWAVAKGLAPARVGHAAVCAIPIAVLAPSEVDAATAAAATATSITAAAATVRVEYGAPSSSLSEMNASVSGGTQGHQRQQQQQQEKQQRPMDTAADAEPKGTRIDGQEEEEEEVEGEVIHISRPSFRTLDESLLPPSDFLDAFVGVHALLQQEQMMQESLLMPSSGLGLSDQIHEGYPLNSGGGGGGGEGEGEGEGGEGGEGGRFTGWTPGSLSPAFNGGWSPFG
eukprot:UC1_evm5s642